jgi:prolyl-tRNA synthetase
MVHGDDQGLVLPPKLAPYQVVIVPIGKSDEEKSACADAARRLQRELAAGGVRVKLDERDGLTPGFKFNDWEMRGVPVRMEIGPKDIAKGQVVLARRDRPGKEGKTFVPQAGIVAAVNDLLAAIQQAMLDRALAFRRENTRVPRDYAEFKAAVESGFAFAHWCGSAGCEASIKEETKATMRGIPLDPAAVLADAAALAASGSCIYCSNPASERAVFARAY